MMIFLKLIGVLLALSILNVVCEPRRGGGGSRGGGSRGGGSRGGGFSSWFSRPSSPVSRPSPSPVFRPSPVYRPAPRPVSRPAPVSISRPASHVPSHQGKPPGPGWNVPPPPYTRYVPKNAPPAYGAPSHSSRPNPPPYTPSVGRNPYHQPSAPLTSSKSVSSVGSSGANYPRQTYTPVTHYGYPVVNTGYGYGYSSPRVVNNYYGSPSYYHRSSSNDILTAVTYYNLGRISSGYHHHPYYHNHNYYNRHYNRDKNETSTTQTVTETPNVNDTATYTNRTNTNIPSTVDLTKQKLFDPVQVPFENVSKHQIDYQPLYLNESVDQLPFYGVEHLTWNNSDTYFVKVEPEPPQVTGLGAKIGNMFYSLISWFSTNAVNENADKNPRAVYYEREAPPVTTPKPLSAEEKFHKLLSWKICLAEKDPERCDHLKEADFSRMD